MRPISKPRGCQPLSHGIFFFFNADDAILSCRCDAASLCNLMNFLEHYAAILGQHMSVDKSAFYAVNYSQDRGTLVRNISGFKEDVAPFVYLGVRIIRVKPGSLFFMF